jgi:hypothetical protein
MKKLIKGWGNSLVIVFNSEEVKIHKLKVGDILDLPDKLKIEKIK